MNKTLKDNKLDIAFLERVIEGWEDYNKNKKCEELDVIHTMLNKKEYENWKCIYTKIVGGNEELNENYWTIIDGIKDYDSEIILEEYFDNTVTLYTKTKGLFICKVLENDKYRIALYKYNDSDHSIVGKSEDMNKLEKKQVKVLERRFIKRFDKDFGWYTFEIVKDNKGDYAVNYTLGINYIISSGSEGVDNIKTLTDLFESEIIGLEDIVTFQKQELELEVDKHYSKGIKDDIRLMKALITFFKNAKKYVEVK